MNIFLSHPIHADKFTTAVSQMFDLPVSDTSETVIPNNIVLPDEWNIGAIVGPSGAGKTSLLKQFGKLFHFNWNEKSVVSNFPQKNPEEVFAAFSAAGFNTIPSWLRPYSVLSTGEKFRADLAAAMLSDEKLILIDEYTSVIDRNVAKSASNALQKFVRKAGKKIIVAACHLDILPWLAADWSYNPTEGETRTASECLRRPDINLKIFRSEYEAWNLFKHSHYLSADLNKAARCFLVTWNDIPVAFSGVLAMPNPYKKNCWRESRTVVLPDFQGLSIGVRVSDYIGAMVRAGGGVYYSKTIHPAMIAYRMRCGKWRETSHSRQSRTRSAAMDVKNWVVSNRFCYAFEYIGDPTSVEEAELFWQKIEPKKRKKA